MTLFRAVLSWFVLLAVAFLNGAVRQFAYPSTLGDFAARQVSTGVGAVALGATTIRESFRVDGATGARSGSVQLLGRAADR